MNRARHSTDSAISEANQTGPPITGSPGLCDAAMDGQRRQAAVMFVDIANSTALCEQIGSEGYYRLIQRVMALLVDQIETQGGEVADFAGDGAMALFGAPFALEDSALRACKASLGVQKAVEPLSAELSAKHNTEIQLRVGINSGGVVSGRLGTGKILDYTALGDTVNLAARLEEFARPGTTLLGAAAFREVEPFVTAKKVGVRSFKGIQKPEVVYRLLEMRPSIKRFDAAIYKGLTTFTARQGLVDSLMRSFRASAGGLRVELISGEPGIGKSRLLHEFLKQLEHQAVDADVLEAHCAWDGHQIPFRPVIDFIRGGFDLSANDTVVNSTERLRHGLETLQIPTNNNLQLLLNILGIVPWKGDLHKRHVAVVGRHTRNLIVEILRARCALSPIVFKIEDLQWIDSASEQLLKHIVERCSDLPLIIIGTHRPEHTPSWANSDYVKENELQPLKSAEMADLLNAVLQTKHPPELLLKLVVEEADGNPLFAEEIVQYLLDAGALVRKEDGFHFQQQVPDFSPPASIQNLVLARVDNLTEPAARLLQAASVLGRVFSNELLAGFAKVDAGSEAPIGELLESNLLIPDDTAGSHTLKFRHALVRDAVYDTLLTARRQELHSRTAHELIQRWKGRENEIVETLVYHFERTENKRELFYYLHMAGSKCLRIYSLDEANGYFQRSLDLFDEVPEEIEQREFGALLADAMRELQLRSNFRDIVRMAKRYWRQIEKIPHSQEKSLVLMNYGHALSHMHNFGRAEKVTLTGIKIAQDLGDLEAEAYGKIVLMATYNKSTSGRPRDIVQKIGGDVMSIARSNSDNYLESVALFEIASNYMHRGQINKARARAAELVEVGRRRDDPRVSAFSSWLLGWFDIQEERFQDAENHADNCMRSALTTADRLVGKMVKGSALTLGGKPRRGREILQEIHDKAAELGDKNMIAGVDPILGAAMVLTGDLTEGMRWLKDCAAERDRVGYRGGSYYTRLIMADVYLRLFLKESRLPITKILRNLPYLVYVMPTAGRRAERLYREIANSDHFDYPSVIHVRVNLGLGLINLRRKRFDLARELLEEAHKIAMEVGVTALSKKAEQAIRLLPETDKSIQSESAP